MDKILSKDTIKNVFSALGAKTSDSNYGVALLDKTSGEPKGLMGMSDLASVLGGQSINPTVKKSGTFNTQKYCIAHLDRWESMTIFLRYGNTTSSATNIVIFNVNNRNSATYTQTLIKVGSPKIYIETVTDRYSKVYVNAENGYPIVEVMSFVPYSSTFRVCLEDATDVDFSQLQEVSL